MSRIRSASWSTSGPGSSDSNIWRPPTRSRGRTASASTMIPIPPSHWLSCRQMRSERSSASTSATTVAPVVVKPGHPLEERVDRSRRPGARPESRYGSAPNAGREQPRERDDQVALAKADRPRRPARPAAGGRAPRRRRSRLRRRRARPAPGSRARRRSGTSDERLRYGDHRPGEAERAGDVDLRGTRARGSGPLPPAGLTGRARRRARASSR